MQTKTVYVDYLTWRCKEYAYCLHKSVSWFAMLVYNSGSRFVMGQYCVHNYTVFILFCIYSEQRGSRLSVVPGPGRASRCGLPLHPCLAYPPDQRGRSGREGGDEVSPYHN